MQVKSNVVVMQMKGSGVGVVEVVVYGQISLFSLKYEAFYRAYKNNDVIKGSGVGVVEVVVYGQFSLFSLKY